MQIGEFARVCNTKISVLRHYDKNGLLKPDYIDRFTGYRYYKAEQIAVFEKICALKNAGFTLPEIKSVIENTASEEKLISLFDKKEKELLLKNDAIVIAKKLLMGYCKLCKINARITKDRITAPCTSPAEFEKVCIDLEAYIISNGYQRTSPFDLTALEDGLFAACNLIKLSPDLSPLCENTDGLEFENDPSVIGKWQVVGEFTVREDFFTGKRAINQSNDSMKTLYFLPNGENYWSFSWTCGKLIIENGLGIRSINTYTVENVGNERYMFVSLKSYYYRRGGKPTTLVLRQLDNISYTKESIRKKDNIDIPFENDTHLTGRWLACNFVREKELFDPEKKCILPLFYISAEFFENGHMKSTYSNGAVVNCTDIQSWTLGYVLEKRNSCACAYEIKRIEKEEYLFLEWKSGDYIYGHKSPWYYVFRKDGEK